MANTHAERIMKLLAEKPGLNDDEISAELSIEPRQTVNQVCRRLANRGGLKRSVGNAGKIINTLSTAVPTQKMRPSRQIKATPRSTLGATNNALFSESYERTLLVIPCSKRKVDGSLDSTGGLRLTDRISPALAVELLEARENAALRSPIDERVVMPAWQRYDGSLYRAGRNAIGKLLSEGMHIIILSGGYGAVLAAEPIGLYNQALKSSWWPQKLLARVLRSYVQIQGIASVRAFASATSPYLGVLSGIRWDDVGVDDALLISPEKQPGGTLKSPASIGEALVALAERELCSAWRSSYGLGLDLHGS